ncbi:MAG TPA: GreA/GreB family elongation factor [Bacillales bacterium]|nr:GreA/GreB family elongation factor [Bacillales bacterium]
MMEERSLVFTPEGIEALTTELVRLKGEKTDADGRSLAFINERIEELENMIKHAVTPKKSGSGGAVETGAVVKLRDMEFDEVVEYTVVNRFEADPLKNRLSEESPLGRALLSKKPGEPITVDGPGGPLTYEILTVQYGDA